ncbi:MAG: zinc-dependent peptidase [Marinilabiliaceae bacterium]|nr:zinc-dependent peptidase [Marinilabiliaceae bacterium]
MDFANIVFFIIIAFVVPLFIVIQGFYKYKKEKKSTITVSKINHPNLHKLLTEKYTYYNKLSNEYKEEFCNRTLAFANHFKWQSGNETEITDEMRLLVSATAIQLTFGLKQIDFSPFETIIIYSDAYYNNLTHKFHKGEVNNRYIILSWKHFVEGIKIDNDKINLGLHELAHALDLSTVLSKGRKFYLSRLMVHFRNISSDEFMKIRSGMPSFLRSYGGNNLREFFSVAVEHFFEAPLPFKKFLPVIYDEMCLLLNQDPASNIYRGVEANRFYKQNNNLSINDIAKTKPLVKSNISFAIIIPFISATFLAIPVYLFTMTILSAFFNFTLIPFIIIIAIFYWFVLKNNIRKILIDKNHIIIKQPLSSINKYTTIAIKNILYADFRVNNTYEKVDITYIDKSEIKTKDIKMYFTKSSLITIKKMLLQNEILIRQNNIWSKKQSK